MTQTIKHPITEQQDERLYFALERLRKALYVSDIHVQTPPQETEMYAALDELCQCLASPVWGLVEGWKRDALTYKRGLQESRIAINRALSHEEENEYE